jgi:pimeloyl-ACP methyl ester carboxylesterase
MVDINDRKPPTAPNDTAAVVVMMPPLPVGTRFLDRLRLLHPRTLWYVYKFMSEYFPADMDLVRSSVLGMFLPALTLGLINGLLLSPAGLVYSNSLLVAYLASPWTVGAGRNLWQGAQLPSSVVAIWTKKRSFTLPDAYQVLQEQLDSQGAYRRRRYDVYLPSNQNDDNTTKGILFLPGALVEHAAYSEIATNLSQDGNLLVVVISLEPTRISAFLSTSEFRAIQRKVQKEHGRRVTEWTIAGHSLGAKRAVELAEELNFPKVVLWGFGGFHSLSLLQKLPESVHCLIINGSKDGLVIEPILRGRGMEEFEASLPSNVRHTMIQGGSHQYFGTYKPQVKPAMLKNTSTSTDFADISRHEQHAQVSSLTAEFVWQDFL